MPPIPSSETISYPPSLVPVDRVMNDRAIIVVAGPGAALDDDGGPAHPVAKRPPHDLGSLYDYGHEPLLLQQGESSSPVEPELGLDVLNRVGKRSRPRGDLLERLRQLAVRHHLIMLLRPAHDAAKSTAVP